jgi:hypothetical protein
MRQYVELAGMLIEPNNKGSTSVSCMCIADMEKPLHADSEKTLDDLVMERALAL